jgi:hypothetical protein
VDALGLRVRWRGGVVDGLGVHAGRQEGGDRGQPEGQGAKAPTVTATSRRRRAALGRGAPQLSDARFGESESDAVVIHAGLLGSGGVSPSNLGDGANRQPTARQQAAIGGA